MEPVPTHAARDLRGPESRRGGGVKTKGLGALHPTMQRLPQFTKQQEVPKPASCGGGGGGGGGGRAEEAEEAEEAAAEEELLLGCI